MNTGNGLLGLLNSTAAFVWNRRCAGLELDAIASELASAFDQPLECVQKDVRGLQAKWDQAGLLACKDERLASVSGAWPCPEDAPRVSTVVQLNTAAVRIKSWLPTGTDVLLARLQHRMQPDGNADRIVDIFPVGATGMAFAVDGLQCGSSPDADQGGGHLYEIL
ncbi:PqqD family protein [Telmatobacter bradus]|uniref:PqqD family protein n=1 Tax=Telmatobacter bradus TaxID=474953 RepID=UPI003B42F7EF